MSVKGAVDEAHGTHIGVASSGLGQVLELVRYSGTESDRRQPAGTDRFGNDERAVTDLELRVRGIAAAIIAPGPS